MNEKIIHDFKAMGSPCKLVFYTVQHTSTQQVIDAVCDEIQRLEKKHSRYRGDSVASAINRTAACPDAARRGLRLDPETAQLLNYADVAFRQSNGLFDISSGVFRRVWDLKSYTLPTASDIRKYQQRVGWKKIRWREPEIYFPTPYMELDFGGYVKEYAVDKACAILEQQHVYHAYIDLGGDIGIVGPQIDNSPWNIGIRDPANPQRPIATIELSRGAIASSGDYERCMKVDGKTYSHIINPKTGWPVDHWACVSVVADQCIVAGTAATVTMLKERAGNKWLRELGLRAIAVDHNGQVFTHTSKTELKSAKPAYRHGPVLEP